MKIKIDNIKLTFTNLTNKQTVTVPLREVVYYGLPINEDGDDMEIDDYAEYVDEMFGLI